jgi:DNA polymerase I-like protein with 3'-5' exonuclease and polymerase domains
MCGRSISSGGLSPAKIVKGTRQERVVPYNSPATLQAYVDGLGLQTVINHETGRPTTGKKARAQWVRRQPEFATLGALKQQVTLRNNFAKTSLLAQPRMYFNLKIHGTSEGRLSSSGRRRGIDLNIQNQPKEFRVIYVPDQDGWGFVSLDLAQGENFLTTWIAQDWERWERLQDPDYDEHSALAQAIFGHPVTKALAKRDPQIDAERQIGKKINHGRNYGMGARKQLEELVTLGYDHFRETDVREFIEIWKKMNARTAAWQQETIEIVKRQGYLRNAFGRVRWMGGRSSATEALAFLPASTLADTVLRMMIAHYPERYARAIAANEIETALPICEGWRLAIQVHDELALQGPWDGHEEQARRTGLIMTQSWKALGGFRFRVDVKGSQRSWGECKGL